jgi:hypothetical protein
VADDQELAVLRILADRRRSLGEDHTRMVSQLHRVVAIIVIGALLWLNLLMQQRRGAPRTHPGRTPTPVASVTEDIGV